MGARTRALSPFLQLASGIRLLGFEWPHLRSSSGPLALGTHTQRISIAWVNRVTLDSPVLQCDRTHRGLQVVQ